MSYRAVIALFCSLACAPSLPAGDGQKKNSPESATVRTMQTADVVHTKIDEMTTMLPNRCDADGNIYMRPYSIGYRFGWGQVQKFNPKGENTATFSAQPGLIPTQFFVAGDGTVYVMAFDEKQLAEDKRSEGKWSPDIYILRYKKDGTLDRKTKLDSTFVPSGSFVVFPSGEVLVSAIEAQTGPGKPPHAAFTALFSESGELLRRVSPKDDDWIDKAIEAGDSSKVAPGKGANPAVATGQSLIATDGNAYVMRRSLPAVVYVISPGGSVVRTLTLSSGDPPKFPSIMLESQGQLAIVFQNAGPSEPRLKVFEAMTGKEIETVNVATQFGSEAACFTPPATLTFVRVEDGKFVFTTAEAR